MGDEKKKARKPARGKKPDPAPDPDTAAVAPLLALPAADPPAGDSQVSLDPDPETVLPLPRPDIIIEVQDRIQTRHRVAAMLAGDAIHLDVIQLADAAERLRFARAACRLAMPGVHPELWPTDLVDELERTPRSHTMPAPLTAADLLAPAPQSDP